MPCFLVQKDALLSITDQQFIQTSQQTSSKSLFNLGMVRQPPTPPLGAHFYQQLS